MRLGRMLLVVAILLILLVVIAVGLGGALGGGGDEPPSPAQLTQEYIETAERIYVLAVDVDQAEIITVDKVQEALVIPATLPKSVDSYVRDPSLIVGKYAIADLKADTYIEPGMLVDDPSNLLDSLGSTHTSFIKPGMVAVSIPISRFSAVSYGVDRGDYINLVATFLFVDLDSDFQSILPNNTAGVLAPGRILVIQTGSQATEGNERFFTNQTGEVGSDEFLANIVSQSASGGIFSPQGRAELDALLQQPFYLIPSEAQRPRLVSQTVLFDRQILHVGAFPLVGEEGENIEQAIEEQAAENTGVEGEPTPIPIPVEIEKPDIITLIVTPQEAVMLNYLIYSGAEMTLALRARGDHDPAFFATDAVTLDYLMNVYRIPLPIKLPYGFANPIDELAPPVLTNDVPTPTPRP